VPERIKEIIFAPFIMMKKKRKKIILLIICSFFIFWLVEAQVTMKFRETDLSAKKEFDSLGINLLIKKFSATNFKMHYV